MNSGIKNWQQHNISALLTVGLFVLLLFLPSAVGAKHSTNVKGQVSPLIVGNFWTDNIPGTMISAELEFEYLELNEYSLSQAVGSGFFVNCPEDFENDTAGYSTKSSGFSICHGGLFYNTVSYFTIDAEDFIIQMGPALAYYRYDMEVSNSVGKIIKGKKAQGSKSDSTMLLGGSFNLILQGFMTDDRDLFSIIGFEYYLGSQANFNYNPGSFKNLTSGIYNDHITLWNLKLGMGYYL